MNTLSNNKNLDIALFLLRIGVGIIFIYAGFNKLINIEGPQNFFGNIGIPAPALMAWVVGIVEFFGGLMVLFGAYIRIPAVLLAIIMFVAILTTKLGENFPAYRLDMILLLINVSFVLVGAGSLSVDEKMKKV